MPEIKVRRVSEITEIGPDGRARSMMRIEFTVDEHGPFTTTIPRQEFDPSRVRADIEHFARRLTELTG
jgi:hypothetical protein